MNEEVEEDDSIRQKKIQTIYLIFLCEMFQNITLAYEKKRQ